jgi:hypothetical protein
MDVIGFFPLGIFLLLGTLGWIGWPMVKIWRVLKGCQNNYHRRPEDGTVFRTKGSLTKDYDVVMVWNTLTIMIRRGLFRGSSEIRTQGQGKWKIAKDWFNNDPHRAVVGDWVSLTDSQGLPAEAALHLIARYPSLRSMLDDLELQKIELDSLRGRIERLEGNLDLAHYQRKQLIAALLAVLSRLEKDRSRFKSSFSKALRVFLTELDRDYIKQVDKGHLPDPDPILVQKWEENLDHRLQSVVS